jgi:hypothetical protein
MSWNNKKDKKIDPSLDFIMLLFRVSHPHERNVSGNVLHSFDYVSAPNGSGNEHYSYS